MLLKDKYLEKFSAGIANAMVVYARNSATGVLAIWEVVKVRFYDQDIGRVVKAVEHNLHNEDLLSSLQLQPSERFFNLFEEQKFAILISKFFDYYWSRLPILLKCSRVIHHGKKQRPTAKEIEIVSRASFKTWAETYPNAVNTYIFSGDYSKFAKLTKWYVQSGRRDDEVYDAAWLFDSLKELYPEITADDNVGNITTHVIKSCFPMFWDTFQSHYRKSLFYYANLGWFTGDLDTEELCEKIEKEKE
jgi:hypothetical protein